MTGTRCARGVQRTRSRKLWVPYSGFRWPPPRLVQLGRIVVCMVGGHVWSPWQIDDMDGPGEDLGEGAFMPYCARESLPSEFGTRACPRCGAVEVRRPVDPSRVGGFVQDPPPASGRWVES